MNYLHKYKVPNYIKTAKANQFDKRPFIGSPSYFKGFTLPKK